MTTEKQFEALMLAYSGDHILCPDDLGGVHPRTVSALHKKGLLTPEDKHDLEGEYLLTPAGREELGLTPAVMRPPKRSRTAILRGVTHFLQSTGLLRQAAYRPEKLPYQVWVNDEQVADFTGALLVVDLGDAGLEGFEDEAWSCAAQLATELGFPCYVERLRGVAAFWPTEE